MIVNIQWVVLRFFFSFSLVHHPNSSGNSSTVTECYFVIGATAYTEKQNTGNHINETQFREIFTVNIAKYDSQRHANRVFPFQHTLGYGRPLIKNSKEKNFIISLWGKKSIIIEASLYKSSSISHLIWQNFLPSVWKQKESGYHLL